MRGLAAAIAAAAVLGVGLAVEPTGARAAEPVVERRAPSRARKSKRAEERALRAQPVPEGTETRQQRRARQRGYRGL